MFLDDLEAHDRAHALDRATLTALGRRRRLAETAGERDEKRLQRIEGRRRSTISALGKLDGTTYSLNTRAWASRF